MVTVPYGWSWMRLALKPTAWSNGRTFVGPHSLLEMLEQAAPFALGDHFIYFGARALARRYSRSQLAKSTSTSRMPP